MRTTLTNSLVFKLEIFVQPTKLIYLRSHSKIYWTLQGESIFKAFSVNCCSWPMGEKGGGGGAKPFNPPVALSFALPAHIVVFLFYFSACIFFSYIYIVANENMLFYCLALKTATRFFVLLGHFISIYPQFYADSEHEILPYLFGKMHHSS